MSKTWYPVIDYGKCTACMICNDMCNHGVFRPGGNGKPEVVYGNGCIHGCRGCGRKCPAGAIHYFGDNGTLNVDYDFETYRPELELNGRKPRVAFICVHNSCRSQMAEALGKLFASASFESYSAGTHLKAGINPDAVRLIKNLYNIDMEETQKNKLIADIPAPDIVIFMGCNVSCPNVPSQYAEDWGLDDPSGKSDEEFVKAIQQIERRIKALVKKLK
jgi:arsenate reductase